MILHCYPLEMSLISTIRWFWIKIYRSCITETRLPVFQVKHLDSSQGFQSVVVHWGQSSVSHFCMVTGVGSRASSHKLLSTLCVMLFSLTMQWAALICIGKKQRFVLRSNAENRIWLVSNNNMSYLKSVAAASRRTIRPFRNDPFEFHALPVPWNTE